jgi:nucleotide-binding universal stress UspA family protein
MTGYLKALTMEIPCPPGFAESAVQHLEPDDLVALRAEAAAMAGRAVPDLAGRTISERRSADVRAARDLASLSKGKVWVLHVSEREFGRLGLTPSELDEEAQEAVRDGVEALIQAGVDAQGEVREAVYGHAAREIVNDAREHDAGVIVMGSRGWSDLAGWWSAAPRTR